MKKKTSERKVIYQRFYYQKQRKTLLKLIGSKCVLCETKKLIQFHNIKGKPHRCYYFPYIIKNPKEFIPLCYHCHALLHRVKSKLNLEIFFYLLSQLLSKSSIIELRLSRKVYKNQKV